MSYEPKIGDAAIDLARCLNSSYRQGGFNSENFSRFYNNSLKIINNHKNKISADRLELIMSRLKQVKNDNLSHIKRREDLLMASNLLLMEHTRSIQFDNLKQ